ncbi:MAG TPA: hypothetical protein DCS05_00450 [Nitrospiraceae bacterium]|nr:hypothetical protein [Nitrospiraceae bacterium]
MTYPEADRIRDERNAAILAENARLRGEVAHQNLRLQNIKAECRALEVLQTEDHAYYLRRTQLEREGLTLSADRVAMGRSW